MPKIARYLFIIVLLFSSVAAAPARLESPLKKPNPTQAILDELGGTPCFDGSAFTCVTIDVPLDHFNLDDTRTIPVVFAVLPASGKRKGMFVTATGGPGTSGVLSADWYLTGFDPSIPKVFDIVFFDQRGVAMSGDLACPQAASTFYQHDTRAVTPAQEEALKQSASTFSTDCVNALTNQDILPYMGTEQVVEDLELFRQIIGDKKFWLYGESYGTQYAQIYAAKHSDHLAGLILDGTVDLTLNGFDYYTQQANAFNKTLVDTMSFCENDPACVDDMMSRVTFDRNHLKDKGLWVYDFLVLHLKQHPIDFRFPLPNGGFADRQFTFANLEFVTASQLYNESDRMMFTRALAGVGSTLNVVPLARLFYIDMGLDPQTGDILPPDSSYSDAVFYGVECQDYGYPGDTPEQKAENYIRAGDQVDFSIPRLASIFYSDLPCAYWPNPTSNLDRPNYVKAKGVPTLVLGAIDDPATPVINGINVYNHLANGYLITQQGGPHVIFGRGNACPDAIVTKFLVKNVLPAKRETVCDGVVADDYVPLVPYNAGKFENAIEALSSTETQIDYLPEYYYWDGITPTNVGCDLGGTLSFEPNDAGTLYLFNLNNCTFSRNFILTGTGKYDPAKDRFTLNVSITGRWDCNIEYTRAGNKVTTKGKCGTNSATGQASGMPFQSPQFFKPNRSDH